MEEKKTIKLKYPVEIKQEDGSTKVYDEVKIGRLKNKHLKLFPKDFIEKKGRVSIDRLPKIVSIITELSEKVTDEFDMEDTTAIVTELESFFGQSQIQDGKE